MATPNRSRHAVSTWIGSGAAAEKQQRTPASGAFAVSDDDADDAHDDAALANAAPATRSSSTVNVAGTPNIIDTRSAWSEASTLSASNARCRTIVAPACIAAFRIAFCPKQ